MNWLPTTRTVVSGGGIVSVYTRTGTEMMTITIRMIVGMTVHRISRFRSPSTHEVGRGETLSRYRTKNTAKIPKTTAATTTANSVIAQNRFWISSETGPAFVYARADPASRTPPAIPSR